MYAADFNDLGLDPTLAMEISFFETFAMTGLQEMGLDSRRPDGFDQSVGHRKLCD
jgi:hypothetical protein